MSSPPRWTWVWANSGRLWRTGKPGMLQSMGLQTVGHDWATELTDSHYSNSRMTEWTILFSIYPQLAGSSMYIERRVIWKLDGPVFQSFQFWWFLNHVTIIYSWMSQQFLLFTFQIPGLGLNSASVRDPWAYSIHWRKDSQVNGAMRWEWQVMWQRSDELFRGYRRHPYMQINQCDTPH